MQPLRLDDLPTLEAITDGELLDRIQTLKHSGTMQHLLAARREGIRRGIVTKLEADLLASDREPLKAAKSEVGRAWYLVEELDPPTRSWRHLTDRGIEVAKERLAEAQEMAREAERCLRDLEKRYGLQAIIKYRFNEG